ncbi:MAG: 3-keto-5-aminohexanoate cleavage protein [Bacteroidales bacterium]|jgi:3-keto-5-aminohexanoate cleavage enzyme|nr:3-keto-5-aminohexanoate cleavage protein [Bacteroidales bacterium]MCI2122054.1 3-keto-5-aminohexanoate cleavage protein [Bacteroidales bacterium]MCI2144822.1 3-keto-5-aminohexanoate cleavage protein [Bacteroidales bacterium]
MEKLVITAAICGAEVTKKHNPAVPYTVEECVREARSAYNAGAAMIHLHVREDDGTPTQSKARFKAIMDAIREACPGIIIMPSTGGACGMTDDERLQPTELNPEIATLDCGTLNFGGDDIFVNTENSIKNFARKMQARHIKPEIECFDKSHIEQALRIIKSEGTITPPFQFNIGFGVNGGIGASILNFGYMRSALPEGAVYTATGIGRHEFPIAMLSILDGGHVRVGFEDNVYLSKGVLAPSNGALVEKVVRMAREFGREIASPDEARKIMSIN